MIVPAEDQIPEAAGGRPVLTVSLPALAHNWRTLRDAAPRAETAAVVKADAYGLGLPPIAAKLKALGCATFFVATIDEGRAPRETFYDGYVVNAIMDACYRSAKSRAWEAVDLFEWRGGTTPRISITPETYEGQVVIKRELLPDGREKLILKDPATGDFTDRVIAAP